MKALISPMEVRESGYRVAEVCNTAFEVASPLFWVDCNESVNPDMYWFDPTDNSIKENPVIEEDTLDTTVEP